MSWIDAPGLERRPLVFVEDHLYHTTELLEAFAATRPDLLASIAICAAARPGPDTDATVAMWRSRFSDVQTWQPAASDTDTAPAFAKAVARLVRPGGLVVQDIQLSALSFIPADRWWESIYLAATVRGLFAERPPAVRFLSNKKGYSATFGRDLLDAGFDPRDVMDKADSTRVVVPTLTRLIDQRFPARLQGRFADAVTREWRVADDDVGRLEVEAGFDILLWPTPRGVELRGRIVAARTPADRPVLKAGSHEATTWLTLVEDRLAEGAGLAVVSLGERIGPPGAGRAETTNMAARHIHTLRGRLTDSAAIITANHAYRIAPGLRVAVATAVASPAVATALGD
jgi:hypothetical protein